MTISSFCSNVARASYDAKEDSNSKKSEEEPWQGSTALMELAVPYPEHPEGVEDHPRPYQPDHKIHHLQQRLQAAPHTPPHRNLTTTQITKSDL